MKAVSFLLALFCIFTISAPHASAAERLTGAQVAAVANLLASMNVDPATITKVANDLNENPSDANAAAVATAMPIAFYTVAIPGNVPPRCQNGVCTLATTTAVPLPQKSAPVGTSTVSAPMPAPVCTLVADKTSLSKRGGQVTLSWNSQNATEVSMPGGGKSTQLTGSLTLNVKETTVFVKKAYGPGGYATCSATVSVEGDKSPETKVALNVLPSFSSTLADIQAGAALLADTSINLLFGF